MPLESSCGADGEELHELAGVVLVGDSAGGGVGHGVVAHVEILAHGGAQRDVFHDLAVVGEGIVEQHVLVGDHVAVPDELVDGGNEDLAEGEGDALAKLIRIGDSVGEEVGRHASLVAGDDVVIGDGRHGELIGDPLLEAEGLDGGGVGGRGTEGTLFKETSRGSGGDLRIGDANHNRKRSGGDGAVGDDDRAGAGLTGKAGDGERGGRGEDCSEDGAVDGDDGGVDESCAGDSGGKDAERKLAGCAGGGDCGSGRLERDGGCG